MLGFIPVLGEIADIINGLWYFAEGDIASGVASFISALPGVGSWIGGGMKILFKCNATLLRAAHLIEAGSKVIANTYTLISSAYDIGQKVGKIYYDTQVLGLDVDGMDVLGIAVDVFSAAVVGQSFLKDLKALDRARTMELHPACFIAGTQITVQGEDGEATAKPIEEIEAGDKVLATDAETGETEYKEVVRVFVKESDTLVHLTVNGEEITTTPDHPFFVGDDWIAAGDLREGDLLTLADGTTAPLEKIRIETLDAPVTVYNFEVADFHTYYVGNTQILVHNDCKSGSSTPDIGTGGNKTSVAGEITSGIVPNKGFTSFAKLKETLGDPGNGKQWHHFVEQSQIGRRASFSSEQVNNLNNIISIPSGQGSIHSFISAHYSSKFDYTNGQTVRDWLSTKSFDEHFKYGKDLLEEFGEVIETDKGWKYSPYT